ncbi:uncharacterized protein LOC110933227 [Helianthus annuus]|uniref:uncharacterized protein LOC110933227 n=1 Tax=Helianthus annuus TaxID=4232 RepID=UPI000B8FAB9D|nr:uncharacterized protein LOC110933227 [Helianthus annuus]
MAVEVELFHGFKSPNEGPVISHLLFADDAIIVGEWSRRNVNNIARLLRCFYLVPGLKINYFKSSLFGVGVHQNEVINMANEIKCKVDSLPCAYFGLRIGSNMNRMLNWEPVLEVLDRRLSVWKSSTLSMGGRLTILKAILETIRTYFFSLYRAPQCVIDKLEVKRRIFFGGKNDGNYKMSWVCWEKTAKPKDAGGLGLRPL